MWIKRRYIKRTGVIALAAVMLSLNGCGAAERNQISAVRSSAEEKTAAEGKEKQDTTQAMRQIFAMDTYMTVTAYGAQAEQAVSEAETEIKRLDQLWDVTNQKSEIAILNQQGTAFVSNETAEVIRTAVSLNRDTDGAFDITVYPLVDAWGFVTKKFRVPSETEIKKLLKNVNSSGIRIGKKSKVSSGTVKTELRKGVQIDLGGIAKGYTSAKIMKIFQKYGCSSGVVSLGGNVQTYKKKTDGSDWRVGIENPDPTVGQLKNQEYLGTLHVVDKAVITSGGYERYFEKNGKKYHHILDPTTGYPAESGLISVTIVSSDGTRADGLSTSLFVMGKKKALAYWKAHADQFDAILVSEDGSITVTEGLKQSFETDLNYQVESRS